MRLPRLPIRGRVVERVRHGYLYLTLDVPANDVLLDWAAVAHKSLTGHVTFFEPDRRTARESVSWEIGYCVGYQEEFEAGDDTTGAYVCHVRIASPKLALHAGRPGKYVPPAPREHGQPVGAASAVPPPPPGTVSTCPPDVTARLQMQVELMCNTKGVKSRCIETDACPTLLEKIAVAEACIKARELIMNQCFGGGDQKHQEQVDKRKSGIKNCRNIYARQCIPQPERSPIFQPVPRQTPEPQPIPHKPNPAVPVGLTGVALLLYYFMTGLEAVPL